MELYIRFMVTLATGLLGMGMVLKVLLDGIFNDADAVAEMQDLVRNGLRLKHAGNLRTEDVMLEIEKSKAIVLSTSIYEQKRHDLEVLSAIESKVKGAKPVPATPTPYGYRIFPS